MQEQPADVRLDQFSDRWNPVFVWEVRRMLKSRYFAVSLMLIILLAWWLAVVSASRMAEHHFAGTFMYASNGATQVFRQFLLLLAFPNFVGIPFLAYYSFRRELNSQIEHLWLSPLRAGTVVTGKLWSSLLYAVLSVSLLGPYLCMSYFVCGIGLGELLLSFLLLACGTAALVAMALCFASLATTPIASALMLGLLLLVELLVMVLYLAIVGRAVSAVGDSGELLGETLSAVLISSIFLGIGWSTAETQLHVRSRPGFERLDFMDWPRLQLIAAAATELAQHIRESMPMADDTMDPPSRINVPFSMAWTQTIHAAFRLEKLLRCRPYLPERGVFLVPDEADLAIKSLLTSLDAILRLYGWTGLAVGISRLNVCSKAAVIPRSFPRIGSAMLAEFTAAANALSEVCRQHELRESSPEVTESGVCERVGTEA